MARYEWPVPDDASAPRLFVDGAETNASAESLRTEVSRLAAEVATLKERGSCSGCHAAGRDEEYAKALDDVRAELLALIGASPAGPPHLYDEDVERICGEAASEPGFPWLKAGELARFEERERIRPLLEMIEPVLTAGGWKGLDGKEYTARVDALAALRAELGKETS